MRLEQHDRIMIKGTFPQKAENSEGMADVERQTISLLSAAFPPLKID